MPVSLAVVALKVPSQPRGGSRPTSVISCAKQRSLLTVSVGRLLITTAHRLSQLRMETGVFLVSDDDLLERCPRRGHARRHRIWPGGVSIPCSSIGSTNLLTEFGSVRRAARAVATSCTAVRLLRAVVNELLGGRCGTTRKLEGHRERRRSADVRPRLTRCVSRGHERSACSASRWRSRSPVGSRVARRRWPHDRRPRPHPAGSCGIPARGVSRWPPSTLR
jgi:hypothetical protein